MAAIALILLILTNCYTDTGIKLLIWISFHFQPGKQTGCYRFDCFEVGAQTQWINGDVTGMRGELIGEVLRFQQYQHQVQIA